MAGHLDEGTLSVARYNEDGTVDWLPLVHSFGPLTAANGFSSQADVMIETRRAADLLGATKMDRPEDIQANPLTGKILVSLTNNIHRTAQQTDAANPRAHNEFGHIIEMSGLDGDHAADRFTWEILVLCGVSVRTTKDVGFAKPDNIVFDSAGRTWVATDGNSPATTGRADGLWAVDVEGEQRGAARQFYAAPPGAELCGPVFTPDDETLFMAVQHPGGAKATALSPSAGWEPSWPDFQTNLPPRSAVIVVTKPGGGKIGV